ncbi:MAG: hypothetical protein HS101_08120 [Planctomycetia bacterium]|nr:hypothetical protein [Planctomycetia bacterium]
MRKFKRLDRQVCDFLVILIGRFELQANRALPLVKLAALGGIIVGRHFAIHPQFQKRAQLCLDLIALPLQFLAMLPVLFLSCMGAGANYLDEPLPDFGVVDSQLAEQVEELPIYLGFGQPHFGMAGPGVV